MRKIKEYQMESNQSDTEYHEKIKNIKKNLACLFSFHYIINLSRH